MGGGDQITKENPFLNYEASVGELGVNGIEALVPEEYGVLSLLAGD